VRFRVIGFCLTILAAIALAASYFMQPAAISQEAFAAQYQIPVPPAASPMTVYHLGHSLVGRDMPAMLAQLVPGHSYASQLGWGASLHNHWTGDVPGFDTENTTSAFKPAKTAIGSGLFDAVVLTEMVEIKDAIAYHDSAEYLALWTKLARTANPNVRVYFYETWHQLNDPDGWLNRIDSDLAQYWEGAILRPAMAVDGVGTIYVIPGGQVMAAFVREIDAGRVPGMTKREDLFRKKEDGTQDQIHYNDLGAYLMALTHYAVLYGKSPVGLPNTLLRADGTAADAPSVEIARKMQEVVWQVVTSYAPTGVGPGPKG
jgi:hypothetical protein